MPQPRTHNKERTHADIIFARGHKQYEHIDEELGGGERNGLPLPLGPKSSHLYGGLLFLRNIINNEKAAYRFS